MDSATLTPKSKMYVYTSEKSSRLISLPTILLLALSAFVGVMMLVPMTSVHAASAAVSLSTSSTTVGSDVTVTGTGFLPGKAITVTMDQYTGTTQTWTAASGTSEATSLLVGGALTSDADGNFQMIVDVPTSVYGSHTFTATDGTNSATAAFSTAPSISLTCTTTSDGGCGAAGSTFTSGFVDQKQGVYFSLKGFPASTKVTITTTPFATTSYTITTDSTGTGSSSASGQPGTVSVAKVAGGAYTITATTTTAVATATFTVNPAVAFYSAAGGTTVFSINPTTFSGAWLEGYGFASGTIAANSITLGGVTVSNPPITVGTDGSFGVGAGNHTTLSLPSGIPAGPITATVQGNTFSFKNGNIICPTADATPCHDQNTWYGTGAATPTNGVYVLTGWGSALVSSPPSSNLQFVTDATAYQPANSVITVYGYGGTTSATVSNAPSGFTFDFSVIEQPSGGAASDTFWGTSTSGSAIPDVVGFTSTGAAATYSLVSNGIVATFGITPWVATSSSSSYKADYTTAPTTNPAPHGFESGETAKIYVGGVYTGSSCTIGSTGTCAIGSVIPPDLAGGAQAVSATGSLSGANPTGAYTLAIQPAFYWSGCESSATATTCGSGTTRAQQTALSITQGSAGSTTILRTGTGSGTSGTTSGPFGVHGLAANTGYSIVWGIGSGATTLATFTSTATGGIPGGQIQFSVGSGTVGYHIVNLVNTATGASAAFDTHEFPGTFTGDAKSVSCFNGASLTNCNSASAVTGSYGDLIFSLTASIGLSPSAGNVGSTIGLSAAGLSASTSYYVWIQDTPGVYITNPTSTSTGGFAAGTTFTVPAHAGSLGSSTSPGENATSLTICVDSLSGFQAASCANTATFILQATASLSSSTAAPGGSVTLSATGLAASSTYNVVLKSSSGAKFTVAAFVTSALGAGTTTVPIASSMAAGTYTVELLNSNSKYALVSPPSLTVSSSAVTLGTSTLTATGSPAESVVNGQPVITGTFTNTAGTTLSVWMWVNILTSTGASSGYVYIGSATMASGQTVPIGATLLNLPHGTYTAQVFVTTTSGIAVSTTSTTAAFTV